MKHNSLGHEAGLIHGTAKLAPPQRGATTMNLTQCPLPASQWLSPDHQAVLSVIARWFDDLEQDTYPESQRPQMEKDEK